MQSAPGTGRVAIITGASAGIGLAVARGLSRSGFRLIINSRRSDRLRSIADELNSAATGKRTPVTPVAGDAADPGVIGSMLAACRGAHDADPDAVIINAGRGLAGSVLTSDPTQWESMFRTNVLGAALLARAAAERMSEAPGGGPRDIVVIGSIVGRHVSPFSSMYGSTKFALHGLTEGLRRELAPKKIRVSLVEPGFVASEFQGVAGYEKTWFDGVVERIGPVLEPEDVARVVSFILEQPPHVHVGDVVVRPTRQDYP